MEYMTARNLLIFMDPLRSLQIHTVMGLCGCSDIRWIQYRALWVLHSGHTADGYSGLETSTTQYSTVTHTNIRQCKLLHTRHGETCCISFNSWTRDYEFMSGEIAFHWPCELVITSGELELGSCNSSSPLCD